MRDDPISAACFTNFGTDPKFSVVDEDDLHDFITSAIAQFATTHWKIALGAPLLRKMHKQAQNQVPFLPRKGVTAGKDRCFKTMIYDRTNNLWNVRGRTA